MEKLFISLLATSLVAVFAILFALPTMLLWNWALEPAVEGVNQIGFLQAMGINLLAGILFKSSSTSDSSK